MIRTEVRELETEGFCHVVDITPLARELVGEADVTDGLLTVFVPGATAAVTTVEFEDGLVQDLRVMFDRSIPQDGHYYHNDRWKDGNGFSHVRASLLGPSLQVPIFEGRLTLGTWQQIVLLDFDNHPRRRRLVFQVQGECEREKSSR